MPQVLAQWSLEPWVLACIAAAVVPYALGMARMGPRRAQILGKWRALSFLGGMLLLFLALMSPLDTVSDSLFSAHMFQHTLLLLVIPPMLVYGRPVITWLWAFDVGGRRMLVHGWKRAGFQTLFYWLMRPLCTWVLLTAALCFWHLPGPYDAAVRLEWLHDLEHLSFLGFSLAFWTIVIEPYGQRRALGYGATVIYVVSFGVVMGMIGAVLTFAPMPLYAAYLHTTQAYGLTPLQDQQLAGIIMWIPSNVVHAAALCTVFFAWYRDDQQRGDRRSPDRARAGAVSERKVHAAGNAKFRVSIHSLLALPIVAILLGGCTRQPSPEQAAARRGAQLIHHYGCGSCHRIPGINDAVGQIGPPLTHWSRRRYIAGLLPNNPANLALWIQHPQQVVPGSDMPDMGVKPQQARQIAAYLNTIK